MLLFGGRSLIDLSPFFMSVCRRLGLLNKIYNFIAVLFGIRHGFLIIMFLFYTIFILLLVNSLRFACKNKMFCLFLTSQYD